MKKPTGMFLIRFCNADFAINDDDVRFCICDDLHTAFAVFDSLCKSYLVVKLVDALISAESGTVGLLREYNNTREMH